MSKSYRKLKNAIWFCTFGPVTAVPCHWCRQMLIFDEATVDHEPALSEGGKRGQAVIACYPCNQKRGQETFKRVKGMTKLQNKLVGRAKQQLQQFGVTKVCLDSLPDDKEIQKDFNTALNRIVDDTLIWELPVLEIINGT